MGELVSGSIPTIFNGVSRQPDHVRLTGQVQDANNVSFSVVTGGFSKRAGSEVVSYLGTTPDTSQGIKLHAIARDLTERYQVVAYKDTIRVFDVDGTERTVTLDPSATASYVQTDPDNLVFTTALDVTFVLNKTVTVAISGSSLDSSTMPHRLVRQGDGTFKIEGISWSTIPAGPPTPPTPDFVGKKLNDIVLHRNRLGVASDETIYFSQAGSYFDFWPEDPAQLTDADPFGVTAGTNNVSVLRFMVPFRRALFATADERQFEVSAGDVMTPENTSIDMTTSYTVSPVCRPVAVGDTLYFASQSGRSGLLLEYVYNDETISDTATDVSKHCLGYIPSSLVSMVGDTTTGSVVCLSSDDRSRLWFYRFYWSGDERAMSSWGSWHFDNCTIHDISIVDQHLYVALSRDNHSGELILERVDLSEALPIKFTWLPRLDHSVSATGVYDSGTNTTSWTFPDGRAPKGSVVGISSTDFPTSLQMLVVDNVTRISGSVLQAPGDWSGGEVMFGESFSSSVPLSKLYVRDERGTALIYGRLQVRVMEFAHADTGFYQVIVTPKQRPSRTHTFNGRILGSADNIIQGFPIQSGTMRVPIVSRGDTVRIEIRNDTFLPHTISSASWSGFYNDMYRA